MDNDIESYFGSDILNLETSIKIGGVRKDYKI